MKILREQCETCIFRPGNLMHLRPGRVADMVRECQLRDTHITCHDTLEVVTGSRRTEAVCRGYLDTGMRSQALRISERLGLVEEVEAVEPP